jgi:hypothetical protein
MSGQLKTGIKRDQTGAQLTATARSSGEKGPGGVAIVTGPGVLLGVIISTNGTDDVVVDVYDNTAVGSAAQRLIPTITVEGDQRLGGVIPVPVEFDTGCYLNVSGDGAKVVVHYQE